MRLRVTNETRGRILAERAQEATGFWSRFRGLMGREDLPTGEGLWIDPCDSIHMFFMRFPIDVVFLARDLRVVKVVHALPPWRVTRIYRAARSVLELPAGIAEASGTTEGDQLRFDPQAAMPGSSL